MCRYVYLAMSIRHCAGSTCWVKTNAYKCQAPRDVFNSKDKVKLIINSRVAIVIQYFTFVRKGTRQCENFKTWKMMARQESV